jgi:hypothetical protein
VGAVGGVACSFGESFYGGGRGLLGWVGEGKRPRVRAMVKVEGADVWCIGCWVVFAAVSAI